jgi:hypothetical protein
MTPTSTAAQDPQTSPTHYHQSRVVYRINAPHFLYRGAQRTYPPPPPSASHHLDLPP